MVKDLRKSKNLSRVDPLSDAFRDVCLYAARIATLLKSPVANTIPYLEASLDDLLGALYALVFATEIGFEHRANRQIEISAVLARAEQVSTGQIRVDGKWMAGFHFNSALYRISATYHRTLKLVVGKEGDVGALRPDAEQLYLGWTGKIWKNDNLRAIHGQVTDLKHSKKGIHEARRQSAGLENAIAAVGELLDLMEGWT